MPISFDDYDYPPPPRLQPATKLVLGLLGFCLIVAVIGGIAALAHRSGGEPASEPAVTRRPSRTPISPSVPPATRSNGSPAPEESIAPAVIGTGIGLTFLIFLIATPLVFLVTEVLILAWVVKDARARGSDGAVWLIVILMSWLVGLLVYLASRPPGMLTPCEHCGNPRLDYLKRCPYCLRDV